MSPSGPKPRVIVIAGPTASGKTEAGIRLCLQADAEVLSADSVQVYRRMDVGSAKPTAAERRAVPHHMIDVAEPDEDMSAAKYADMARPSIEDILDGGKHVVIVGGTGLYIRALVEGLIQAPSADPLLRRKLKEYEYIQGAGALHERLSEVDPETAARLHPADLVRIVRALEVWELTGTPISEHHARHKANPNYEARYVGLDPGRDELARRIETRVGEMFQSGLIEETEALLQRGLSPLLKSLQSPGYKQTVAYLQGKLTLDQAMEATAKVHRRYARRQRVWFRSVRDMGWYPGPDDIPYDDLAAWLRNT